MSLGTDRITFAEKLNYFMSRLCRRKLVITRELMQERPVYSRSDLVIFCVSCTLGLNLWQSPSAVAMYGASAIYCYAACGFLQLVSLGSYLELTSMQPCSGGAFHYAYNSCGELVAFLVGWLMIGYLISATARTFQFGSFLIDQTFFGGIVGQSEQIRFELSENEAFFLYSLFRPYFDIFPLLLCISFSGIAAAEPNNSKIINIAVFFLASCILSSLLVVLIGNSDFTTRIISDNAGAIVASFKDVNACLSGVYFLTFFGDDAVRPKQDIPAAMIWSFAFTWAGLSLFTAVLILNGKGTSLDSPTILWEILSASNFSGLKFASQLGIICAVFCSCFVELYSTVKLFIAMSRDGLIPKAFSKLEHIHRLPVKPTFSTGVIVGLLGTLFKNSFLGNLANTFHMCLLVAAPVLLMKQRYLSTVVHIEDQIIRKRRPSIYCGVAVYVGAIAFFTFGNVVYEVLAVHVFHPFGVARVNDLIRIGIYGGISTLIVGFLYFQPQNYPKSKYKFIGVPFIPMLGIMMYGAMFEVLPFERITAFCVWMVLGLIGYSIHLFRACFELSRLLE